MLVFLKRRLYRFSNVHFQHLNDEGMNADADAPFLTIFFFSIANCISGAKIIGRMKFYSIVLYCSLARSF